MADIIIERIQDVSDEGFYLVVYDFDLPDSKARIPTRFFTNLNRIMRKLDDGNRVQYSVVECALRKTAEAIKLLATHYNATAKIYEVKHDDE